MVDRALLDKLTGIEARFDELERLIADPANISDYEKPNTRRSAPSFSRWSS